MNLTPWNPWQEMERVQEEVDNLLRSALGKLRNVVPGRAIAFVPVLDIVEIADEYRLYVSLPGMLEEDIDISLEGSTLIVRGEREPPFEPSSVVLHQRQWSYGYFERRVQFPGEVEADSIRASYDAGVLTIRVPKPPSAMGASGAEDAPPPVESVGGDGA